MMMIAYPQIVILNGSISNVGKVVVRKIMIPEAINRIGLNRLLNNSGLNLMYSFKPIIAKSRQSIENALGPVRIAPITISKNIAPVIALIVKFFKIVDL